MALSSEALEEGGSILRKARVRPLVPIDDLPDRCRPKSLDDAMLLQRATNATLSTSVLGDVVGTKIGCTTEVMQEYLGMSHPCSGAIFDSSVHHREGRLDFDSFLHVGVECEIAAPLCRSIEPSATPHTMESVRDCVGSVHAAIEVVDDRYVDFEARRPDWRTWVADNFFGAGIVLGSPVDQWQSVDLAAIEGTMKINGQEVGTGFGRDIINGHPFEALVWLANEHAHRDEILPAGWIVMLGSVVQTHWVNRGDKVDVEIGSLGTATAMF